MTAAEAHITAQERLRRVLERLLEQLWAQLPSHHESDVARWLDNAVPLAKAAQAQSVSLTEAYLAIALGRAPLGLAPAELVGEALRGVPIAEVYRRPFVALWSMLENGHDLRDALAGGLARAKSIAATDVQLAMRGALRAVGEADERILGYRRVPDRNACAFCRAVAGQCYRTDQLMPLHAGCGCGVDVLTERNRGDVTGAPDDLSATAGGLRVSVREHGELGPVLTDAAHDFTGEGDLA